MEYLVGFIVAAAVGLTGVGAGSLTAPILILFFGVSPAVSVGTALIFTAVIKIAVVPVYFARKQVHLRVLTLLCAGGLPGVIAGSFLLERLDIRRQGNVIFALLGVTIVSLALFNLYRTARNLHCGQRQATGWLPFIAAGIGTEVGFSSAGAGALGSLALLCLTNLSPSQVVGTDLSFGLVLSLTGGAFHLASGQYDSGILLKLIAGGLVGAIAGASLSTILPSKPLRIALSLWLASLGGQLCWRALA